jgi:hypothetical protein
MALSLRYRPEWETWIKVQKEAGNHAKLWAEAARRHGYHVIYPLAYDPDPAVRKVQGELLMRAIRVLDRRNPGSAEAVRAATILKYPRILKSHLRIAHRHTLDDLPRFPGNLPDVGAERVIPHAGQIAYAANQSEWLRNRKLHREKGQLPVAPVARPRFPGGRPPAIGTML